MVIQGDSDSAGSDASYTGLTLNWTGAEKWFIGRDGTGGTDKLIFRRSGSSNDMVIDTAGNVGIGTTSPSQKLEVNGNMLFTTDGNARFCPRLGQHISNPRPAIPIKLSN